MHLVTKYVLNGLLAILVILACLINLYPYAGFDSATFHYAGLLIAEGGTPYVAYMDNKGPALHYLFALSAYFFSWDPTLSLIIFRIIDLMIVCFLYKVIKHFTHDSLIIFISLLAFWVSYTNTFMSTFETTYAEMPETLLLLSAYILVIQKRSILLVGLLIGLASLFRQTAILHLIVALPLLKTNPIKKIATYAGGVLIPILFTVFIAYDQSWLRAWWQQAFVWPYKYVSAFSPFPYRMLDLIEHLYSNEFLIVFGITLIVWIVGIFRASKAQKILTYNDNFFIILCFTAALVEASLPGKLWRHIIIPLLPALTMIMASALSNLKRLYAEQTIFKFLLLFLMLCMIRPGYGIAKESWDRIGFFEERESTQYIANWIKNQTNAEETILVWGFVPQLYLESQRHSNSAQFNNLLLTNLSGAFDMPQTELALLFRDDFIKNKPKFIILSSSVDIGRYLPDIYNHYSKKVLNTPYGKFPYLERL